MALSCLVECGFCWESKEEGVSFGWEEEKKLKGFCHQRVLSTVSSESQEALFWSVDGAGDDWRRAWRGDAGWWDRIGYGQQGTR